LNAEKGATQTTLADLQGQCKSTQAQLTAVTDELRRSSGLASVGRDIEKARAELRRLKTETAEATKALEKSSKQLTERQAQVNALNDEVGNLSKVRAYNQEVIAKVRHQLGA
jgi:chromosome segregation ATPase